MTFCLGLIYLNMKISVLRRKVVAFEVSTETRNEIILRNPIMEQVLQVWQRNGFIVIFIITRFSVISYISRLAWESDICMKLALMEAIKYPY